MEGLARFPASCVDPDVDVRARALMLWPRLDRRKLARTRGDPARIARLVERRTALSREAIIGILEGRSQADE